MKYLELRSFDSLKAMKFTGNKRYIGGNTATVVRGGAPFFELLTELIDRSKQFLHLQFYIFENDTTGHQIKEQLLAARHRGVKVYLLVDGYASQNLPPSFCSELQAAGVCFRWFEPVFKSKQFYFGRRLHHKVVLNDSGEALIGGINISNRYNDLPNQPAWLDRAVYVKGPIAVAIEQICIKTWNRSIDSNVRPLTMQLHRNMIKREGDFMIRTRENDWVRGKVEITRSYIEMIRRSRSEIIILSSYFLPGQIVRKALSKAAARGVAIKVIIAGQSDVLIAKAAERFWYNWLLRNKIRIYEYHSGILHGKISVYDRQWITAGSYNVNNISAYASVELNLDIWNQSLGVATAKDLEDIIAHHCTEITGEHVLKHYGLMQRFWFWVSYEIYRIGVFLFTFYFRQAKKG